jgi:hypothetical protein
MKTVNAIIERLNREHHDKHGGYVYRRQVERLQEGFKNRCAVSKTPAWSTLNDEIGRLYSDITGFFWGLYSAGFITTAEREISLAELHDLRWPPENDEAAPAATGDDL